MKKFFEAVLRREKFSSMYLYRTSDGESYSILRKNSFFLWSSAYFPSEAALQKAATADFGRDRKKDETDSLSGDTRMVSTENVPVPVFCKMRKTPAQVSAVPPDGRQFFRFFCISLLFFL